ncbi:MAG: DUF4062 domain-containing protein [Candidatus Coatesbacteria bacterium]|nr:DUF4062 domain-containing protein [Candidatus Coatesbacteria bacterium]
MLEETHPLPQFGERTLNVFISSVVSEFRSEREELALLVRELQMQPLHCEDPPYVGEDESPQHACLRMVEDADICLFLFGVSYGFVDTESGLSPTEEELRRSIEANKKDIYLVKETSSQRDAGMQRIVGEVGNYEHGKWCHYFKDETDLLHRAFDRLMEMKVTWDFSNEMVDTFFVIRKAVEHYAGQDMSPELQSKGRGILLGITGRDELPPVPAAAANGLQWRVEPDYSRAEAAHYLGQVTTESYQALRGSIDDKNRIDNLGVALRNVSGLALFSTKEGLRSADVNGALIGWLKECIGVPRNLLLSFGMDDRMPPRLPDWQPMLYG